MTRRIPIFPTLIVAAAVAAMIALGVWQLRRAEWKADLIARYERAQAMSSEVPWPEPDEYENALYRHATVNCRRVYGIDAVAGRSQTGEAGWAHVARCKRDGPGTADVAIGWSRDPASPDWSGGEVGGFIGPYKGRFVRLVAAPPQAGLEQLALPDPGDLPNNHLMYAGQWLFFALTALVIYVLALRKRWRQD